MLVGAMGQALRTRKARHGLGLSLCLTVACLLAPGAAWASSDGPASANANAHAYRHGLVPPRGQQHATGTASTTSASNLSYGGGIGGVGVTTGAPKVYVVFWGSQWGAQSVNANGNVSLLGDPSKMAPYLQAFLRGIGTDGETWSGVMTQYCQGVSVGAQTCPASAAHVGYPTGGALAGVWVDESAPAPSSATGNQIGAEAVKAATHFGNTTASSNLATQYVVVSPSGTHPDGYNTPQGQFCAWHDYTGDTTLTGGAVNSPDGPLAFTNLPYIPNMGASCGADFVNSGTSGALDGVSIVEGHEYAETITDQFPAGGWLDSQGEESGDKCAWISSGQGASADLTLATGAFAVQSIWANDFNSGAGGCEISHPIVTNGGTASNTITVTNPGNQTTTAGGNVSLQIQASDSDSSQTLTYSASGLPAGLSIDSATGVISGTASSSSTYSPTVTVTDTTGASGTTSFSWTVSPSSSGSGGCTAAQLLGNPGFETGTAAPWTTTAGVINQNGSGETAHSGSWFAWLDGYGRSHTDTLAQTVAIPTGCTSYTFGFWLHIDTAEYSSYSYDTLRVQVLSSTGAVLGTLATFSNANHGAGYQQHTYSMAAYAGRTVTVKFTGTENGSRQTSFVIDDTALNVS